jgi:DNA mismatch repair protein MutL
MTGRYAVGFLFLTIPPDKVDVNVHPTKAEVRFQENSLVYSMVRSAVKSRLLRENLVPHLAPPRGEAFSIGEQFAGVAEQESVTSQEPARIIRSLESESLGLFSAPFPPTMASLPPNLTTHLPPLPTPTQSPRQELANRTVAPWEMGQPNPPTPFPGREGGAREPDGSSASSPPALGEGPGEGSVSTVHPETPVADAPGSPQIVPDLQSALSTQHSALPPNTAMQIQDTYLVLETPQGMLVIDQHALHERILFEQLRRRIWAGQLEVQRLLIPEPIDLPAEQAALVLEAADALKELGLEVSDFGGNTILLSSYPTLLGRKPPHEIFQGVVDHLLTKERPPTREAMLHLLMATMACKAAVKAGDRLTPEEISHLLHLRQLAEDSHHCPHGRPTSLLFSRQELDKQFRRV